MVGLRVSRLELDELWGFVGKKQKHVTKQDMDVKGDTYTFVGLAASTRAIVAYRAQRALAGFGSIGTRALDSRGFDARFHRAHFSRDVAV